MYVLLWLRSTKGDAAEIPCFAIIIVVPRVGYYNCDCQAEMAVTGPIFLHQFLGGPFLQGRISAEARKSFDYMAEEGSEVACG